MMAQPMKFSFLDEGETLRRLGVDRDTLLTFVRERRIRAYPGVGKGNFFRLRDIEALYAELRGAPTEDDAQDAGAGAPASGRKVFDPAYKVHVRLQADLKWYDLEDEDLKAWAREMSADGYTRQRTNITMVIGKLQRMIELMDEMAGGWQTLTPAPAPTVPMQQTPSRAATTLAVAGAVGDTPKADTPKTPKRRALPMFGEASAPATGAMTPAPLAAAAETPPPGTGTKPPRKRLPLFTPGVGVSSEGDVDASENR